MKAIILAAGKGTRLRPITLTTPKPLLKVHGKSILEHNLESIYKHVSEIIIVIKYLGEKVQEEIGNNYKGVRISYHIQGDKKGTGGALMGIESKEDIFILYGDGILETGDIEKVVHSEHYGCLGKRVDDPSKYGIYKVDKRNFASEMIEKPQENIGNLANLGGFKFSHEFLEYIKDTPLSQRGEYELVEALNTFISKYPFKIFELEGEFIDITSIEDLQNANNLKKPLLGKTQFLENIGKFELHIGIPQNGINEIVTYSLDTSDVALREGTSDWKKRFISEENLSNWYNDDNRYPFTLLDSMGTVVGLWWGRPAKAPHISEVINEELAHKLKENSEHTHTSGIRIYPKARGKGLGGKFLRSCSEYYDMIFSPIYMSVDIDEHNIASQKAYEKNGFQKVGYGKNINNSPESGKNRFVYLKIS